MDLKNKKVSIIGLGMMGGAFAHGLKKLNPESISAYDLNNEILEQALSDGVITFGTNDKNTLKEILKESDLVLICLYPLATIEFLKENFKNFKEGSIVSDISGIKLPIFQVLKDLNRDDIFYISGHPMAGSEKEGYGGATDKIFQNRNYILVPFKNTNQEKLQDFKELLKNLGFTNIVETTPKNHDSKIAYTSQLCHIIASALVDSVDDMTITDYEGGSYADLTRIAMINAPMWTEIFIENKDLLLEQIENFELSLDKIKNQIKDKRSDDLSNVLKDVRKKRVVMEVDRINKHHLED